MNTLVAYLSKTGHSRKIATAIAEELDLPLVDFAKDKTLGDENVDLLFIVGGLYGAKSDPKMLEAVKKLDPAKIGKVVLLTSCMNPEGRQDMVRDLLTQKGIVVAKDEFNCRGGFLFFSRKRPNEDDVKKAIDFARKQLG
ncbi:MAG: flavodoxin domain-containing protein [Eubacteriales bacterium]|nr:flavodoxin domain-containing protein [Eubacteriales bacterium]MDD4323401.1 flavodoxin domain-containing protein [Eubacteriales bacterium]MDD4540717.1 flavodoxin domain-containing protein [Eubacteriales bacterium]